MLRSVSNGLSWASMAWIAMTLVQLPLPTLHNHAVLESSNEWQLALQLHRRASHAVADAVGETEWHVHLSPLWSDGAQLPEDGDPCRPTQSDSEVPVCDADQESLREVCGPEACVALSLPLAWPAGTAVCCRDRSSDCGWQPPVESSRPSLVQLGIARC